MPEVGRQESLEIAKERSLPAQQTDTEIRTKAESGRKGGSICRQKKATTTNLNCGSLKHEPSPGMLSGTIMARMTSEDLTVKDSKGLQS